MSSRELYIKPIDLRRHLLFRAIFNTLFPELKETLNETIARVVSEYYVKPQDIYTVYNSLLQAGLVRQVIKTLNPKMLEECIEKTKAEQAEKRGRRKSEESIHRECLEKAGYVIEYEITEYGIVEYCSLVKQQLKAYKDGIIALSPKVRMIFDKCMEYLVKEEGV